MEIVSQIVGGQHADILLRQKSGAQLELGELLVAQDNTSAANTGDKIILQVFDLQYGSQMQPEALEWASGLQLENVSSEAFAEAHLRNYVLAKVKAVAHIKNGQAKTPKSLPPFFAGLRRIQDEDLAFLENPQKPLFGGHVRSGSRVLEKQVLLDGAEVLPTHVLIAAGTGKGKSLDGEETVLVKNQDGARFISIESLVDNPQPKNLEVYSVNPHTLKPSFKKIKGYLRHAAPKEMFTVTTHSGRKVVVTGNHSLHVLRNGHIVLLPTDQIQAGDYAASSAAIELPKESQHVNLLRLMEENRNIVCIISEETKQKIDLDLFQAYLSRGSQRLKSSRKSMEKNEVPLWALNRCLRRPLTPEERKTTMLKVNNGKTKVPAEFPISNPFLRYLGYYLAEGSAFKDTAVKITNGNPKVQQDVIAFAQSLGVRASLVTKGEKNTDTSIASCLLAQITTRLVGHGAGHKRMPYFAPGLPKKQLAELLRGYYEGDGSLEDGYRVSATTKSEALASGLTYCLSRFGIHARIHETFKKVSGSPKPKQKYYKVTVTGNAQVQKFMREIGFLYKKYPIKDLEENTNVDIIPIDGKELRRVREALRLGQGEMAFCIGMSRGLLSTVEMGKRNPSRRTLHKIIWGLEKRIDQIQHVNVEKLRKAHDWLNPAKKKELKQSIQSKSALNAIAKQMPCFSHHESSRATYELDRMLGPVNSVNIIQAYNALENDQNVTPEKLRPLLSETIQTLNFPHTNLPDHDLRCGSYANPKRIDKLRVSGIRRLIGHALIMHEKAIATRHTIERMKTLLNLRWEKIKSVEKKPYNKPFVYDISVEENETFYAGRGGLFVHNSNLTKCMLYKQLDTDYAGVLVLDPHNEYYSALKSHPQAAERLKSYSPNPERGAVLMRINYRSVKPWHFKGIVPFSEAQNETLWFYYKKFKNLWLEKVLDDERDEQIEKWYEKGRLKEGTLSVIQRRLELALDKTTFSPEGGQNTVADICDALDAGNKVVIDTSRLASETELMIGSILANEVFERAKRDKNGKLKSIVIEEAPRVLREGESNVFSSIAREGRKFGVGLIAITQLASMIPREVLANMNTKIILGNEMSQEREALIGSAAQDLTDDNKSIAGLDKGEAIISSVYTKLAIPVQFPKFETMVAADQKVPVAAKRFA